MCVCVRDGDLCAGARQCYVFLTDDIGSFEECRKRELEGIGLRI